MSGMNGSLATLVRRNVRTALAVLFLPLAGVLAFQGFARYDQSRANFDEAVLWLGLSLLCLAAFAWEGRFCGPASAWRKALTLLREHWLELALFSIVVGFGAFLRLYIFGDYPASGVIFEEEGVNGRIAYQILDGARPLDLPLTRYGAALGFLLFGENTTGLRFPFVLASIVTIIVLYLLARELVRPPAALLATALAAASPLLMDPMPEMQAGLLAMVLFLYLLVRGMRTRSSLLLLGAGAVGGLLSYEWQGFRLVPLVALGSVGALALKRLAWPPPEGASALLGRARVLIGSSARPVLVALGAAVVVLIPMIVAEFQGENIYFESLERHGWLGQSENLPIIVTPVWEQRLKWAAELFLPFGPRSFPGTPLSAGLPLVDLVTATLLTVAVPYALVTMAKPFRAPFLLLYLVGMAGAALIRDQFVAWVFIPLLPVGLLLVAFLVDDVIARAQRLRHRAATLAVPAVLLTATAFAFASNANALLGTIVNDPEMPRAYSGHRPERGYVLCDYLRGRARDSFAYVWHNDLIVGAFSGPTDTVTEQVNAFGDLAWVCGGLRAVAVAALEEAWPLHPPPAGPAAVAIITVPEALDNVAAIMRQAFPSKARPDHVIERPSADGLFALAAYEFSLDEVRALQGLHARYMAEQGGLLEERVDNLAALRWEDDNTPVLPFTVRWRGVAFLDRPAVASLVAVTDDRAEVRIDGQVSFSSLSGAPATLPQELLPGWHPLEVTVVKRTPGGSVSLRWVDGQGQTIRALKGEDLFPLSSLRGWRHRRTLESQAQPLDTPVTVRFDFEPYLTPERLLRTRAVITDDAPSPRSHEVRVVREEWSAVWRVPSEREYLLETEVRSGALVVTLDGAPVIELPPERDVRRTAEASLRVPEGEHRVEVVQIHDGGFWAGATLSISDPNDPAFMPDLAPF